MAIVLVGASHRGAPVELREKLARLGARGFLARMAEAGFSEGVVLSTCNRFEACGAFEGPAAEGGARLRALFDAAAEEPLGERAYLRADGEAARHLFEVASGLDSLVLGESEILSQVKAAYAAAREEARAGKFMNILFQRALFVGKEVRSRTGIAMGQTSVASVAVELAERVFGRLKDGEVLVLGAGETAEKTVRHLLELRPRRVRVANRTFARAAELAARLSEEAGPGGSEVFPVPWEDFPALLEDSDVVLCATGSPEPVLGARAVREALEARGGRPVFLIDIAMPRDVEPAVGELEGAYLYAMPDLEAIVAENMERRRGELEKARELVRLEALCFASWLESTLRGERASLRRCAPRYDPAAPVYPGGNA